MSGVATILVDHAKRRAGLRAEGRVHWVPPAFYEPLARLEAKYAAMDSAMRHWQNLLDEAREAASE